VPYFIALASHSLVGDFFIGGHIMLFWPLSQAEYGNYWFYIDIQSPVNIAVEWALFVIATLIMFKTKDVFLFFRNNRANLLLAIPILTVLLPTFVGFPQYVPISLVLPHLFYLVVFSYAVLIVVFRSLNRQNGAVKSAS
jgi:hypothetical protein